jgi:hypothetical protein
MNDNKNQKRTSLNFLKKMIPTIADREDDFTTKTSKTNHKSNIRCMQLIRLKNVFIFLHRALLKLMII